MPKNPHSPNPVLPPKAKLFQKIRRICLKIILSIIVIITVSTIYFMFISAYEMTSTVAAAIGGDDLATNKCPSSDAIVQVDTRKFPMLGGASSEFKLKPNEFALTFDDGPWPWTTPHIARTLKSRCVPATFFMTGVSAWAFPRIVDTIRSGGFAIGSHTYWHRQVLALSLKEAKDDILLGIQAVEAQDKDVAANKGRLFRFPRWEYNQELLNYLRSLGATAVFSDIGTEDWRGLPAEESFRVFLKRLENHDRGIISLHDTKMQTVQLVPMIIDEIERRGGRFVQFDPIN